MKQVTVNTYQFAKLSDEAKQKALTEFYDINVSYDWWESTYEDANRIGLNITGFVLDYGKINGDIISSCSETAYLIINLIINEHGDMCSTYKTYKLATSFLADRDALVTKYSDGVTLDKVSEENEFTFDVECDNLESQFTYALLEDYLTLLKNEFEYLSSEAAIIETIEANEYDFTVDGKLFS